MIRKAVFSVIVVFFLLFGAGSFGMNYLVSRVVTDYLHDTCLVQGSLDQAKISLFSGEAVLYGLKIANPKGFPAGEAIAIRSVRLTFAPDTPFKTPFTLREVVLEEPVIRLQGGPEENNIEGISRNLAAAMRVYSMDLHHGRSDPLVRIENLYSVDGSVLCNAIGPAPVRMPTLLLSALGGKDGLPLSQVVIQLLHMLDNAAMTAKTAALPEPMGLDGSADDTASPGLDGGQSGQGRKDLPRG